MNITELKNGDTLNNNDKQNETFAQLKTFLNLIKRKDLSDKVILGINKNIEEINNSLLTGTGLQKLIKRQQNDIAKLLEKELKIVPKNYYRNFWLIIGMSAFGVPIGVALGISTGNMALLAVGLPIGMAIGLTVGSAMDKKANEEGRQLDIELKY